MPKTQEQMNLIGKIRVNTRHNPELAEQQREELRALTAERRIKELVASAPALTDEQRARLAAILVDKQ